MICLKKLRIFIAILLLFLLTTGCKAGYEGEAKFDFRNANWGMSKSKVSKSEETEYVFGSDQILLYQVVEDGDIKDIYYYFEDDKLVAVDVIYKMSDKTTAKLVNDMIDSYIKTRERFIELYGPPVNEDYRLWLDPDPDFINDADILNLYYGRLMYKQEWDTERTYISLTFSYKNTLVEYTCSAKSNK